jgi:molecular chaperone DnaK (HSP70)
MPLIKEKICEIFAVTPHRKGNPDEIVAVGAANTRRGAHRRS